MPLLDLKDIKKILDYITEEGKDDIAKSYEKIPTSTTAIILRKIIELDQHRAKLFISEMSFDKNEKGCINVIPLIEIQDKPKLFLL
jgi:hypothetical protein